MINQGIYAFYNELGNRHEMFYCMNWKYNRKNGWTQHYPDVNNQNDYTIVLYENDVANQSVIMNSREFMYNISLGDQDNQINRFGSGFIKDN